MSDRQELPDADDAAWFSALTGRSGRSDPSAVPLRAAIQSLEAEEAAAENLEADWQRLRFRLRREGLLRPRWQPRLAYAAMAATLVLGIGLVWMQMRTEAPENAVVRGGQITTVVLRVAEPQVVAAQWLQAARQAGIAVVAKQDASGVPVFDFDLPATPTPAVAEFFKQVESELPQPGRIRLIIMPRS